MFLVLGGREEVHRLRLSLSLSLLLPAKPDFGHKLLLRPLIRRSSLTSPSWPRVFPSNIAW